MPVTMSSDLTERLIDRLCHDLAGTFQALTSGLELLAEADVEAVRSEALALVAEAAAGQRTAVAYARRAFGSAPAETSSSELEALARGRFEGRRATLDWTVEATALGPAGARVLLNLVQIALDCLAAGGVTKVAAWRDGAGTRIRIEASGPRAALRDDSRAGLCGEALCGGIAGLWVQGALVHALATGAGGSVSVEVGEGAVRFSVDLPGAG
jgi:hypothetical protein